MQAISPVSASRISRMPAIGQLSFAGIHDLHYDNVVFAVCHFQGLLESLIQEIGYQKDDRALVHNQVQMLQRLFDAGAAVFRIMEEHFTDYAQHMGASSPRRDELLDAIRKEYRSDAIVVLDGGEGEQGGNFGGNFRFRSCPAEPKFRRRSHRSAT